MVEQIFIISFSFDVYLAYILHYNYISNNSSSYFKHYFSHFRIKFKLYNNSTETWQTLLCHFKKCLYHHKEKQHRTKQTFSAIFYSIAPILYLVNLNKISKKTCKGKIFFSPFVKENCAEAETGKILFVLIGSAFCFVKIIYFSKCQQNLIKILC